MLGDKFPAFSNLTVFFSMDGVLPEAFVVRDSFPICNFLLTAAAFWPSDFPIVNLLILASSESFSSLSCPKLSRFLDFVFEAWIFRLVVGVLGIADKWQASDREKSSERESAELRLSVA